MPLPIYLAMTMAEIQNCQPAPPHCAFMACILSSGGTGLSNIPSALPPNTLLMLNDSVPPAGHRISEITQQLSQAVSHLHPDGILLDFQRPFYPWLGELTQTLCRDLPCSVAVTPIYEKFGGDYLFLPPISPDQEIGTVLNTWKGKRIWLELSAEALKLTLEETGCLRESDLSPLSPHPLYDERLCCHYEIRVTDQKAIFHLHRTPEDQLKLLEICSSLGVEAGIALHQEACSICPDHHIYSHRPQ